MDIVPRLLDLMSPMMSSDNIEKVRGFVEENAKLIFTDSDSNVTINLWPWVITGFIFMLAIPVLISVLSTIYVPFYSIYKAASSYDAPGYGRSDYDDWDSDYGYDKWDSEFKRRRRGPGKRPRKDDDDDDFPYYNDDWKNSDYYKSWDRQNRELEEGGEIARNMVVGLADSVSKAVKMIN